MAAKRKCSPGLIKNANHVAVELDSIFASGKLQESGFNRAWKMTFLFATNVKIRLQFQILY